MVNNASEKATQHLHTVLDRCRDAGCETDAVTSKAWNVEADVRSGKDTVKVLIYFNAKGVLTPRVQGKSSALKELVELQLHGDEPLRSAFLPDDVAQWIGVDESGKGDYFGPLVAAAVLVTPDSLLRLKPVMLRDSKELHAAVISKAAAQIREICAEHFTIVTVLPERYNDFMSGNSFGKNSQRILAWMHARCIENLLEKHHGVHHAVCDKFADTSVVGRALMTQGRTITVHQHVRAEADPAVAAAAILARDEFVRRMKQLEDRAGCRLPLGASDERGIIAAGGHIMSHEGKEALGRYAKLHFRTTQQVLRRWSTRDAFDA
ncbi:MAG: ribonuclease HIII [Bacteroidia bacterium]|nr:ribonuclease HIII [Bacteroidia bacterium]